MRQNKVDVIGAKSEAFTGMAVATTPFWFVALHEVGILASAVAAVCGAIIGIHGVIRVYRQSKEKAVG